MASVYQVRELCAMSHRVYVVRLRFIQGEHKVFPCLQTFIARKLRGIKTYFFFQNVTQVK